MSQTIRSHVTNHPVTCHKPIASHRIPSRTHREPIASHRELIANPSHPIANSSHPTFIHIFSHFNSYATHSFLFFILTTGELRTKHCRITCHTTLHSVTRHCGQSLVYVNHRTQPGNYITRTPPHSVTCNSFIPFFILTTSQMREIHQNNHHIHSS